MAQLRAKQIKLSNVGDLLIGGTGGTGTVLPASTTTGQVLKVLAGGALGYEAAAASQTTFTPGSSGLVSTDVNAAILELNTDLLAETARAEAAEGTLTTDLGNEVTRATAAEGVLTTNLAAEVTRATGAEATLTTDLGNEVSRAQAAEGVLASNLTAEATRAEGAETTLTNNLAAEVTRATGAEGVLTSNLAAEVTNRQNADSAIQAGAGLNASGAYVSETASNYINSATSLKGADFLLDAAIKTLAGTVSTLGGSTVTALQTEVDTIEASLGLNTDGTEAAWATTGHYAPGATFKAAIEGLDSALSTAQTNISALAGLGALHFVGLVDGNETTTTGLTPAFANGFVYRVTTDSNTNWAGTGLDIVPGDYVVCIDATANSGAGSWVRFDNTDPTLTSSDANVSVVGGAHEGFVIALANKATLTTDTSGAIVITGGTDALLSATEIALDPSKINFSDLNGVAGNLTSGSLLTWDVTGKVASKTVGALGIANHFEEEPTFTAGANASFGLAYVPENGTLAVFINGVKLALAGWTLSGSTVTLVDSANGYSVDSDDLISVGYEVNADYYSYFLAPPVATV